MRGQDRLCRMMRSPVWMFGALLALLFVSSAAIAQMAPEERVPELSGPPQEMTEPGAPPIPKWVVDDVRKERNYPDQPPVIPHSIEGYQLSVNTNRCLSCHKRELTEESGAPMISVTHYMTREGQMLADVSPRRYFCTACHVPQANVKPLVGNTFKDMSELGVKPAGSE
ncbi:nitrate reductase [Sinorhizobium terangae]|uniref:Periplasmic nitrate reductase, electron transfer subunit n=2 Tax=Sinorhizobium terangae TaxID=110322 RepID=A0A6N7LER0_SINTE|nr:nitrate reductase cytochrome c-type subunit [Sinorhizobium terangae]MQX16076.1 nitrate reductase [Sinorhizobium terangae]WFU50902.1 nitrate reductase cytochrome c-type subunit [Sinorhizobium terangae]